MRVEELAIYPIKSTAPIAIDEAQVEPWGLAADRRWMVVAPDGALVTARRHPKLLLVHAAVLGPGHVRLTGPHASPLEVEVGSRRGAPVEPDDLVEVSVWSAKLAATRSPAAANDWFSALLERPVRLVWLDDPTRRAINPAHSEPGDVVSFADGYPLLLTTRTSLAKLNEWSVDLARDRGDTPTEPTAMNRFRPSVVVDGDDPFDEDDWIRIRIGTVDFRVSEPCSRCVLTTIDPVTLNRGKEPLRTLAKRRRIGTSVLFGANLIPDRVDGGPDQQRSTSVVRVGDAVTVIARRPPSG